MALLKSEAEGLGFNLLTTIDYKPYLGIQIKLFAEP